MEDRLPGEGLAELVELGDPAALLRAVDGLCASRDWAGLVGLRHRLEEAVERGRPLWPVTTYVEYRMALDGPALEAALEDFAGCAVVISHDRFFLDRMATHILAFEGDSHVEWFEGNFQDYEEDKKRRLGDAAVEPHRIKFKRFERR